MNDNTTKPLLITCGCSWTYGTGVGYQPGMTMAEYKKIAWDNSFCDVDGFRGLLAKKYNLDTLNFAHGASSNQRQFRLIKEFITSPAGQERIKMHPFVIILHGITSTARNEMYLSGLNELCNFKYDDPAYKKYTQYLLEYFYSHDNEVARLAEEMNFLNHAYRAMGLENVWFDTFNHHNYPTIIDNQLGSDLPDRDLLTTMAIRNGLLHYDNNDHMSSWDVDSDRVSFLIDLGYLNPLSTHPTKKGHELIADILDKEIEKICQKHNTI
jgi:hypothetical protein